MITVTIDTSGLDKLIQSIGNAIAPTPEGIDKLTRECAVTQQANMAVRVHKDGNDSNDTAIGTYSASYMLVRTGKVPYSDGRRYNRTASTDVVLSLTRQMENDLSVIALPDGYGVGYKNPDNYKKAIELQDVKYKKPIWDQSESEQETTREIAVKYIEDALS
jgi:hypothetical protein